ncbi:MAG: ATP-dependent zinc protease [Parvularculaceae bacterium]
MTTETTDFEPKISQTIAAFARALLALFVCGALLTASPAAAADDDKTAAAPEAGDGDKNDDPPKKKKRRKKTSRGDPIILGYLENVYLGNLKLSMKGKLDTGADTTSVFARDVEIYKKGKRDNWVRFRLIGKDGRTVNYDQNVIRFVRIKTKTGGNIRRPVIHLPLCVGGRTGLAEINLADRSEFNYDVLIGREFLAHRVVVDSSRTYSATEPCEEEEDEDEEVDETA